jgi:hypothetical protein
MRRYKMEVFRRNDLRGEKDRLWQTHSIWAADDDDAKNQVRAKAIILKRELAQTDSRVDRYCLYDNVGNLVTEVRAGPPTHSDPSLK